MKNMEVHLLNKKRSKSVILLIETSTRLLLIENFHLHITNTIKKCYRKIRIIKRLLATPWGCNEKTLLQFYKSHIRPRIDYDLIVYGACAMTHMQKIKATQNDIIRLIFGLRKRNKY